MAPEPKEFFVPLSVTTSAGSLAATGEPNVNEQPRVRAITWSLIERSAGADRQDSATVRHRWRKTVQCGADSEQAAASQLADALQQLEQSLGPAEQRRALLVCCGPLELRQQLHPIARRLRVPLPGHLFDQYCDLSKELERARSLADSWRRCQCGSNFCPLAWVSAAACCSGRAGGEHAQAAASQFGQEQAAGAHACCSGSSLAACAGANSAAAAPNEKQQPTRTRLLAELLRAIGARRQQQRTPDDQRPLRCAKCATAASERHANEQPDSSPNQQPQANGAGAAAAIWQRAGIGDGQPSGHCSDCALLHNEQLVDSMSTIVCRLLNEGHRFARHEQIKRRVEVGLCDVPAHEAEQRLVRARGLPWQATEQDIADFFSGLNIAKGGVGLCLSRQGRRNGEALVQFESREHRNLALARHKHFMNQRYIEVYRASADDFQQVATVCNNNKAEAFLSKGAQVIVRARGLPFSCTAKQVVDFFASTITSDNNNNSSSSNGQQAAAKRGPQSGLARARVLRPCKVLAGEEGVLFVKNHEDKPTGDAFVLFATEEEAQCALAKHHENIGTRYVELFRSSISEAQQVLSISSSASTQTSHSAAHEHETISQKSWCSATTQPAISGAQAAASKKNWTGQQTRPVDAQVTYAQVTRSLDSEIVQTVVGTEDISSNQAARVEVEATPQLDGANAAADQTQAAKLKDAGCSSASSPVPNSSAASTISTASSQAPAATSGTAAATGRQQSKQHNNHSQYNYRAHKVHHNRSAVAAASQSYYSQTATLPPPTPAYAPMQMTHHYQTTGSSPYAPAALMSQQHHYHPAAAYQHQYPNHYHQAHYQQHPHQQAHHYPAMPDGGSERDCLRLRGLPFEAQVEHVLAFLGPHSEHILIQGVHMVYSAQGKPTGEAIVQMSSAAAAAAASLDTHKRVMQVAKKQRYIEVMPQSLDELRPSLGYGLTAALAIRSSHYAYAPPSALSGPPALPAPASNYCQEQASSLANTSAGSSSPEMDATGSGRVTTGSSPATAGDTNTSSSASSESEVEPSLTSGSEQEVAAATKTVPDQQEASAASAAAAAAHAAAIAAAAYYSYHPAHFMYYYSSPPGAPVHPSPAGALHTTHQAYL